MSEKFGEEPSEEEIQQATRALYSGMAEAMVEHRQEKDEKRVRRRARKQS